MGHHPGADALAQLHDWTRVAAVQAPYSLLERDVERELLPMAQALGLTFTPWGMLEGGALTGKYLDESDEPRRYDSVGPKANALAREVIAVAEELGRDARTGRDRVGARAAVAHDSDRRRPNRVAAPREPRRTRSRARSANSSNGLLRRASSGPGSRATSSSRSTSAGSSSATRSSSSTILARLHRGSARR